MPSDIRLFFGPKGAAPAAAPAKPAAKKPAAADESKRRTSRRVVEDSDDDEPPAVAKPAKPAAKPARKPGSKEIKGVEITTSQYFGSSMSAKPSLPKEAPPALDAEPVQQTKTAEVPHRASPRTKQKRDQNLEAPKPAPSKPAPPKPAPSKPERKARPNRAVVAYQKYHDQDGDAYMDDADKDADDIFSADVRIVARGGDADDYEEEEDDDDDDDDEILTAPKPRSRKQQQSGTGGDGKVTASRKRKSPEPESEQSEEEEAPAKKKAAKSRASRTLAAKAKRADQAEDPTIQGILDNVPLVRAPTPPPKDPNAKFDWKKAAAGGGGGGVGGGAAAEMPEGEEDCLIGLNFVFTGVLDTLSREDGQALIKRYGGKVTGQPSSKTSFVVLGSDAGPSKLTRILQMGIKTINEEGLFDLIRKLPAHGGSGKGAAKAQEKKQKDEDKAREQAAEMEKEERAQRLKQDRAAAATAAARGVADQPARPPAAQLWTSKYAPSQLSHICGNKANVERINKWLANWHASKRYKFQRRGADGMGGERAIIISGPPGIGKTTAAHLAARLAGFDVLETNASDTRSKRLVEEGLSQTMNNTSLLGFFGGAGRPADADRKRLVLIMDEVDGMSAGDRGGVGALAKLCRQTSVPMILICNDRRLPKMKPFDHAAFDIKFQRPTADQVRSRMMTICHREGVKMTAQTLDALIEGSGKDIRQIINMLSTAKLDQAAEAEAMGYGQGKAMAKAWEKHVVLKPWDICQKMLGGGLFAASSRATLNDKIELYFNDHEFSYLMIQENYLKVRPLALSAAAAGGPCARPAGRPASRRAETLRALELFDAAAESISDGDLVDRMIHGPQQHWSLMPTHAVLSTVRPASFVAGQLMGTQFTSWLGHNSRYGKLARLTREIHSHMRLRSSGDHHEVRQEYLPVLWARLVGRMAAGGGDGRAAVDGVIDLMDAYYLTRDDWDAIKELGVGPQNEDLVSIETATKSAFTRLYNSRTHPVPFMRASLTAQPAKKASKEVPDLEEAIEEEDEAGAEVDEPADGGGDDNDLKGDKYIKPAKAKAKRAPRKAMAKTAKAAKAADNDDDNDDDGDGPEPAPKKEKASTRGGGGARGKGRGRGRGK